MIARVGVIWASLIVATLVLFWLGYVRAELALARRRLRLLQQLLDERLAADAAAGHPVDRPPLRLLRGGLRTTPASRRSPAPHGRAS